MGLEMIVLSSRENDLVFWEEMARQEGFRFRSSTVLTEIAEWIRSASPSVLVLDGEHPEIDSLGPLLREKNLASSVYVITDGPAAAYPRLFSEPMFSHHLYRRYDGSASFLCSRLLKARTEKPLPRFEDYFPHTLARSTDCIKRSGEKYDLIDRYYQIMIESGVLPRIADISADALDELLMNAIFDAPVDSSGKHYRRKLSRDSDFALLPRETVTTEIRISPEFIGIRVSDLFGSLNPQTAVYCIGKNFDEKSYVVSDLDPGAGLGLMKLAQSISLIYRVEPRVKTESIALIGNSRTFRELRHSFNFFSVQSPLSFKIPLK